MNYDKKIYGTLLLEALPGIIESDEEYGRLENIFNDLINKGEENLSPEQIRLFALLANLMEDYERRTLEAIAAASPVETLEYLMRENNLKQKDLAEIFGGQSVVSDVLKGKREINKAQARKLGEKFSLSPAAFI
ncbi:MAG TPA: helix-turn-helix domain-containing protein [Pyrinomonadaceae bacterium]|jgi:HTH-type transcriptional regulator/antitoxin HigA